MSTHIVKILIIELLDHSEVVYNICSLLHLDKRIRLSVICKPYIIGGAAYYTFEGVRFIPICKRVSVEQQLKEHTAEIQSADLIIWSTVPLSCKWIERNYEKFPNLIMLHNLRSWIHPYSFLDWKKAYHPLFWARLMRTVLLRRSQQDLLKSCKAILVLEGPLLNYLETHTESLGRKARLLPLQKHVGTHHPKESSGTVQIVIPGSLIAGKGYKQLADGFKAATPSFEQAVELTLLGHVKSTNLLKRLQAIVSEKVRVNHFTYWITPDNFDRQIEKADFLVLPYGKNAVYGIVREKWGVTKASGTLRDAILHQKTALIGSNYHNPPENCVAYKDSESLARYLISWVNEGSPTLTVPNPASRSGFNGYLYSLASSSFTTR